MSVQQRRVLLVLSLIGLVYFDIFAYPNAYGAETDTILFKSSGDEYITYPYVVRILTPGKTFNDTRANLFLYEDYHYGYPFYAISSLVVLPVRLIFGMNFTQHMQLNLWLLRQLISLLPMILAAGLLVFMQTRFQSLWKSVVLFILLLTIRGVVRNHIWWWHPDALTVLCVVLTLFFLDLDRLRFGRFFYLAAVACGLATAIKLLGAFFFLTIPAYLLVGWLSKRINLRRAVLSAVLFVGIMAGVTVFSNPFLFSKDQRARLVMIQTQKQQELNQGYEHDDPIYYSKGPQWWVSTLEKWYGSPVVLIFLFVSLLAGCVSGSHQGVNRLILSWVVPYSIYLLYFVAVKPDHYWLPVMLPLFSAAFNLVDFQVQTIRNQQVQAPGSRVVIGQRLSLGLTLLVLVFLLVQNLARDTSGNIAIYRSAVETGISQVETLR